MPCNASPPQTAQQCAPRSIALDWQWQPFAALSAADLYAALVLRAEVFVVEQACAFADPDGIDPDAWHLLGWQSQTQEAPAALIAYLRVVVPGRKYAEPALGRVITAPSHRGCGLGRRVMIEGIARTRAQFPGAAIRISAQQRLQHFYESLGFGQVSATYLEDGIDHIEMLLPAAAVR